MNIKLRMLRASLGSSCSIVSRMVLTVPGLDPVEHFGDGFDAAIGAAILFAQSLEFLVEHQGDFLDHFWRKLVHFGKPPHHFRARLFGQQQEDFGRRLQSQMRQNQGHGLWVLALHEHHQLLWIGSLQ